MRLQRMFAVGVFAPIAFTMFSGVVLAHHSRAQYGNEESTTKGTVVEYIWKNPHVFVVWKAKDQTGKTRRWVGEMASVTAMFDEGMTKDSLKPGDSIIVIAFPSRKPGSTEALIKKITKADGTVVVDNSRAPNLRQP